MSEKKYISLRVPKTEYDKLKNARNLLTKNSEYSWATNLSLGSFIGLIVDLAMKENKTNWRDKKW